MTQQKISYGKMVVYADNENAGNTYLAVQTVGPSINIPDNITTPLIIDGVFEYSLENM